MKNRILLTIGLLAVTCQACQAQQLSTLTEITSAGGADNIVINRRVGSAYSTRRIAVSNLFTGWPKINRLGHADADGLVSMGAFTLQLTSTKDGGDVWRIDNTDADIAATTILGALTFADQDDPQAVYLILQSDSLGATRNDYEFGQTLFTKRVPETNTVFAGFAGVWIDSAFFEDGLTNNGPTRLNGELSVGAVTTFSDDVTFNGGTAATFNGLLAAQGEFQIAGNATFFSANLSPTSNGTNFTADYAFGARSYNMTNNFFLSAIANAPAANTLEGWSATLRNHSGGPLSIGVAPAFRRAGTNNVVIPDGAMAKLILEPDLTGGSDLTNHLAQIIPYVNP